MVEYKQTLLQKQAVGPLEYFLLSNKGGNAFLPPSFCKRG